MKLGQLHIILIAVLISATSARGQERPKAELLDEFGRLPCEHILSHTDTLAVTLQNEPGAIVAIVISRPNIQPTQAENRRRLISSTLRLRRIDHDRFKFFLEAKSPDGEIRTQFWLVRPGAPVPVDDSTAWDEPTPDISRPFRFGYTDEADICPTYVPKAFADLLLANPGSVGKITVTTGKYALGERFSYAKRWTDELVDKHGVPRQRLRLSFRKSKDETGAEFWFIPSRNRSAQRAIPTSGADGDLRLVDEFDPRGCETLARRLDDFAVAVLRDPQTKGHIVVRKGNNVVDNAVIFRGVNGYIAFRNLPRDRFVVLPTEGAREITTQLWIGKDGNTPSYTVSKVDLTLSSDKKKIPFAEDTIELVAVDGRETYLPGGNPTCLHYFDSPLIWEFLAVNPSHDAEFTIKAKSAARYQHVVRILKEEFVKVGAPTARVRFVYGGNIDGDSADLALVTSSLVRKKGR